MGHFICQYIKRDGSICGKECMSELGCARHYNALLSTICPVCKREPIPILESVAIIAEFMTVLCAKVKKLKQNLIWLRLS